MVLRKERSILFWAETSAIRESKTAAPTVIYEPSISISENPRPSLIVTPGIPPSLTKRLEQTPIGKMFTDSGNNLKNLHKSEAFEG